MTLPMKKIPGVPDRRDIKLGMAYFEDTGPWDKTCGDCAHRGVKIPRQRINPKTSKRETVVRTYGGCAMFKLLTGRVGPTVNKAWKACKYFKPKPGSP